MAGEGVTDVQTLSVSPHEIEFLGVIRDPTDLYQILGIPSALMGYGRRLQSTQVGAMRGADGAGV